MIVEEDHKPTRRRYLNGCRCDGCRAENTRVTRESRARRMARIAAGEQQMPPCAPGSRNNYTNYGCHCDICKAAHAESCKDWRSRNPEWRRDYRAWRKEG